MALSRVASVKRAGGLVCNPSTTTATALTFSPSETGTSNLPSSDPPSSMPSLP